MEAVELVAATEGFFKLAVEPLDEPPIRNDEPKNKFIEQLLTKESYKI